MLYLIIKPLLAIDYVDAQKLSYLPTNSCLQLVHFLASPRPEINLQQQDAGAWGIKTLEDCT